MVIQLLLQGVARPEISREIPFQYRDGLIRVKVELAGSPTPLNFLLDSGASVSALDLQTAQKHGIHFGDQEPVQGVNGYSSGYRVADVRVTLGGNALPKRILAIDLGSVGERCHRHIDGILGFDFFRNRIIRIDFNAGDIALLKKCDPDRSSRNAGISARIGNVYFNDVSAGIHSKQIFPAEDGFQSTVYFRNSA